MPRQTFLNRVAVYKLGPNLVYRDQLTLVPTDEIFYCFTAGAISSRRIVISASWGQARVFRPGIVYLRTGKGLFATRFRTLARLASRLDRNSFAACRQSVVVNLSRVIDVDMAARLKMVRVGSNDTTESLTISRRFLKPFLKKLTI
jgi:hypothetical protein